MKSFCNRLLLTATVIFCFVFLLDSVPVRADSTTYDYGSYNNTMYVVNATDTSITVDWSDAAKDLFASFAASGKTNYKFKYLKLGYAAAPYDMNQVRRHPTITLKPTDRQYTITGLKPDTEYFVTVQYETTYDLGKGGGGSSHNFQTNMAGTTGKKVYTPKLLGTTGTTATIDYRDALKELESDLKEAGYSSLNSSDVFVGISDEANGAANAKKEARSLVGRKINQISSKQSTYTMRGLTPGHSYSVCIGLSFYSYDKDRKIKHFFKYIELNNIKASGADDSAKYPANPAEDKYDRRADAGCRGLDSRDVKLETSVTEDSITLNWANQYSSKMAIKAGQGESKICLAIVEEKQYDPVADRAKYGGRYNYGPNAREAKKKADARMIQVDPSKKSYTFTNLKKGTSYTIVMKCGYKDSGLSCNLLYPYLTNVKTAGGKTRNENETYVKKHLAAGYNFDIQMPVRKGKVAELDWTKAVNNYFNQIALADHYARVSRSAYSATCIGYAKLPANGTQQDISNAYSEALKMSNNKDHSATCVETPYTNTRIYGLDPNARYVFALVVPVVWYDYGYTNSFDVVLYADETGINFYKAKDTKANYDGRDIFGNGSGGSGNDNSGNGNSGNGNGGSDNSGNDNNENGNGGSNNSGENNSGNNSQSRSDVTPVEQPSTTSSDKNDGGYEAVNKKQDNHAWIYCNKKALSRAKLNKKSQTVTIKIENSKGKINVSDLTKGKCSKSTDIKIKGRKVKITFKKGAPKGTYKFKVTVGAKGKAKKTTETIKIKVR